MTKTVFVFGRHMLINSVLGSFLTYFMSLFEAPTNIINKIEYCGKKFVLGGNLKDK